MLYYSTYRKVNVPNGLARKLFLTSSWRLDDKHRQFFLFPGK